MIPRLDCSFVVMQVLEKFCEKVARMSIGLQYCFDCSGLSSQCRTTFEELDLVSVR